MKIECSKCNREFEVFSVNRVHKKLVKITIVCKGCGRVETETVYLCDDRASKMKKYIKEVLVGLIISFVVVFIWRGLEWVILNEIRPNKVDNIIALVLIISIYFNIRIRR